MDGDLQAERVIPLTLTQNEEDRWVRPTRFCFYENRQQIGWKQKCGGPICFGIKGFFKLEAARPEDSFDFFLCYQHGKWWNSYFSSWCPAPKTIRVEWK